MSLELFVKENIVAINNRISDFASKKLKEDTTKNQEFNDTAIKKYLQEKFALNLKNDPNLKNNLFERLREKEYVKARIIDIANEFILYSPHLKNFYQKEIYSKIGSQLNEKELAEIVINEIKENKEIDPKSLKFVESDLKKIIIKAIYLSSRGGFTSDLQDIDSGLRVANEGDSAQFLFVARAILAGFNCSNVDVRSSRYDAIIDYHSKLLRIQIKGITSTNKISFFDRDRGGEGIDYTHERNQGKRITKEDCDIYVAVDKQVGICYIIPMTFASSYDDDEAKNVSLDDVECFKEAWQTIIELANA
jgi:hypothetical protein